MLRDSCTVISGWNYGPLVSGSNLGVPIYRRPSLDQTRIQCLYSPSNRYGPILRAMVRNRDVKTPVAHLQKECLTLNPIFLNSFAQPQALTKIKPYRFKLLDPKLEP